MFSVKRAFKICVLTAPSCQSVPMVKWSENNVRKWVYFTNGHTNTRLCLCLCYFSHALVSPHRHRLFRRLCSELFSSTDNKRSGTTVSPAYCQPLVPVLFSCPLLWFTMFTCYSSAACYNLPDTDHLHFAFVCTYFGDTLACKLFAASANPYPPSFFSVFSVFLGHTNAQRDWHTHIKSLISGLCLSFIPHLSWNTKFSREEQPDTLMLLASDICGFI